MECPEEDSRRNSKPGGRATAAGGGVGFGAGPTSSTQAWQTLRVDGQLGATAMTPFPVPADGPGQARVEGAAKTKRASRSWSAKSANRALEIDFLGKPCNVSTIRPKTLVRAAADRLELIRSAAWQGKLSQRTMCRLGGLSRAGLIASRGRDEWAMKLRDALTAALENPFDGFDVDQTAATTRLESRRNQLDPAPCAKTISCACATARKENDRFPWFTRLSPSRARSRRRADQLWAAGVWCTSLFTRR